MPGRTKPPALNGFFFCWSASGRPSSLFLSISCYPAVHLSSRNRRGNTSRESMGSTLASSPVLGLHTRTSISTTAPGRLEVLLPRPEGPRCRCPRNERETALEIKRTETMNSLTIGLIVFATIFASGLLGLTVQRALLHRLGSGEKEVARLVTGLMTTMAAIVLRSACLLRKVLLRRSRERGRGNLCPGCHDRSIVGKIWKRDWRDTLPIPPGCRRWDAPNLADRGTPRHQAQGAEYRQCSHVSARAFDAGK